jgi:hypothetical protein
MSYVLLMVTKFKLDKLYVFDFFIICVLALFYLFEKNVTRRKLLKHRDTYRNRRKYLQFFILPLF